MIIDNNDQYLIIEFDLKADIPWQVQYKDFAVRN